MSRPRQPTVHGTRTGYSTHGCKCDRCRAKNTAEQRKTRRQQLYGTYDRFVPAQDVRAAVQALEDAGLTRRQVADAAGLTLYGLNVIMSGKTKRSLKTTLEQIQAVKPDPYLYGAPEARLDCTGAVRRLRALAAIGWTITDLANEIGIDRANLAKYMDGTYRRMARYRLLIIRDMYERFWDQPKDNKRALNYARKQGWHPPLAWDDDEIDSPSATPHLGKGRSRAAQMEDLTWTLQTGAGWGEVLQRTGYGTTHDARRAAYLAGRPELARILPESEKTSA